MKAVVYRGLPDHIVAIQQRGIFTGNRGIIHDPATKTLLSRRWTSKAWLVCSCQYKNRRREVMAGRSWTELFFLDEAVALAAGHRPCFLCRREAAKAFRAAWAAAVGGEEPSAAAMDMVLHHERMERGRKPVHAMPGPLRELDGRPVPTERAHQLMAVTKGRTSVASETSTLKVGDKAPDFELTAHNSGEKWRLSDQKGKNVVIAFYPFAFTPV